MGPYLTEAILHWLDAIRDPLHDLPDEDGCRLLLADLRFQAGFACPHCGSVDGHRNHADHSWHCHDCRAEVSVTAHTIMHRTRMKLRVWLAAIWYMTQSEDGISVLRFQRLFDLPAYRPPWRMFQKIRECFAGPALRGDIKADASPSLACIQVLGRNRPDAPHLAAHVALDLSTRELVVAAHRTAAGAMAAVAAEPRPESRTAHMLLESFRSCINSGTYHGVSVKWLPRYVAEFFGRWRGELAAVDVLARLVATRRPPPRVPRLPQRLHHRDDLMEPLPNPP